jgi:heptosyltransferase-3
MLPCAAGKLMASLIYHAGALGDFITALPAVSCWRQAHPGEKLILLGKPAHAALGVPPFDEVWDAEARRFAGLFSGRGQVPSDVVSALVFAREDSPLPRVLANAGVKEVVRQDPFPSSVIPIIDYHLSLFPVKAADGERIPRISIPATAASVSAQIALHPGSGSRKKNWPFESFLELSRRLSERGGKVAWVLGPAEDALSVPSGHEQWRSLSITELAARLAHCRLFVGNDSGVTHLSAAAGCPTVALFGESDPRIWAPRGKRVSVIASTSRGMKGISVGDVSSVCQIFLEEK